MANGYDHSTDRLYEYDAKKYSWAPFIGLVVVAIFCGAAWFLAPKGEEQTYVKITRATLLVLALYGFYQGLQS